MRLRWLVLLVAAGLGAGLFGAFGTGGGAAAGSFVLGTVLAVAVLEIGLFNLRYVDRWMPQLTMAVAVGSYLLTGAGLALVLAASSPRVIVPEAISTGLLTAVVIEIGYLVRASWVRAQRPDAPVTLSLHDERPTST
jgi:hypothetical protein